MCDVIGQRHKAAQDDYHCHALLIGLEIDYKELMLHRMATCQCSECCVGPFPHSLYYLQDVVAGGYISHLHLFCGVSV